MNKGSLVLITGCSGFIGSHATAHLAKAHRVVGLDVEKPSDDWKGEEWLECDLTDDESVESALARVKEKHGGRITSVLHLSAYYDFSGEPSPMYEELTVNGTRRLLRGLREFEVEQFIFASSLLVMKPAGPEDVIDETSPTEAAWDYPESKLDTERVLREEARGIPVVVLRIAGVYDEDCHSLPIAQHIARIDRKEMESYVFPGDPERGQPYVHIKDLMRAFGSVVDRRKRLQEWEVFLIAEPRLLSYGELQERIGELIHGKAWPTIRIPPALAKGGAKLKQLAGSDDFIKPWMIDLADAHYPVSIDKAWKLLGWEPSRQLAGVLPDMIRRLEDDRDAWYAENGID